MKLEDKLEGWTGPSSDTEAEKQDRTIRMIREAVDQHGAFKNQGMTVELKGSYPNNTNVRIDSDVDVYVQCAKALYSDEHTKGAGPSSTKPYEGIWTPAKLRSELAAALTAKFGNDVDVSGSLAIRVNSSTARVDADVLPSFSYKYYFSATSFREGTKSFRKNGTGVVNYPVQQLELGKKKNVETKTFFKQGVRILKRLENEMCDKKVFKELPSYFIECLGYNCSNEIFMKSTWTETVKAMLLHIWTELQGEEPEDANDRWREVNECKWLFSSAQKWTRDDGRQFTKAAWNYLEFNK